jgi:hypothetical protein
VSNHKARILSSALEMVSDANEGVQGSRYVANGIAEKIVDRSLAITSSLPFSIREHLAIRDLSDFIRVSQRGVSMARKARNTDLLPIGHPLSTRSNKMSNSALRECSARWIASDPNIKTEEARSLVAAALSAGVGSVEHNYYITRLSNLGEGVVPLRALIAAFGDGNSSAARSARARLQRRDRNGRFAWMGGGMSALISRGGQIFSRSGRLVGQGTDSSGGDFFDVEYGDGTLARIPASTGESRKGTLQGPGDGYSPVPSKDVTAKDPIINEADIAYIDAPEGFYKDQNYDGPGEKFTDDAYDVIKYDPNDDEAPEQLTSGEVLNFDKPLYVVRNSGDSPKDFDYTAQSWAEMQDYIRLDQVNADKAEGRNPGVIAQLDEDQLNKVADETPEGSSAEDTAKNLYGDLFDSPSAPDSETEKPSSSVSSFPNAPEGAYIPDLSTPYSPEGRIDQASVDYTDDPIELGNNKVDFSDEDLRNALSEAISPANGLPAEGFGNLEFSAGNELVPAEAIAEALQNRGFDPTEEINNVFDSIKSDTPVATLPSTEPTKPPDPTPDPLPSSKKLPPLLEGLSEAEKREFYETGEYKKYLPNNEVFEDVPEEIYAPDSAPFDNVFEFPYMDPLNLANDYTTEDLIDGFYESLMSENNGMGSVFRLDSDAEQVKTSIPSEALRDALQLQGEDPNEIVIATIGKAKESVKTPVSKFDTEFGADIDISTWVKDGGQAGSNEGAFYRDPASGLRYYVKKPESAKHARNEALASAFYNEAGVRHGRIYIAKDKNGEEVLVSPIVQGDISELGSIDWKNDPDIIKSAQNGFVMDAWLNNWDSVGAVYDNMIVKDGEVYRIDPGGALLFRAQGADKSDTLTPEARQIDDLRNPDVSSKSGSVFGSMTDADVAEDAKKLEGISPERISELVDTAFSDDPETASFLKENLLARRDTILARFLPEDVADDSNQEEPNMPIDETTGGFTPEMKALADLFANNPEAAKQFLQSIKKNNPEQDISLFDTILDGVTDPTEDSTQDKDIPDAIAEDIVSEISDSQVDALDITDQDLLDLGIRGLDDIDLELQDILDDESLAGADKVIKKILETYPAVNNGDGTFTLNTANRVGADGSKEKIEIKIQKNKDNTFSILFVQTKTNQDGSPTEKTVNKYAPRHSFKALDNNIQRAKRLFDGFEAKEKMSTSKFMSLISKNTYKKAMGKDAIESIKATHISADGFTELKAGDRVYNWKNGKWGTVETLQGEFSGQGKHKVKVKNAQGENTYGYTDYATVRWDDKPNKAHIVVSGSLFKSDPETGFAVDMPTPIALNSKGKPKPKQAEKPTSPDPKKGLSSGPSTTPSADTGVKNVDTTKSSSIEMTFKPDGLPINKVVTAEGDTVYIETIQSQSSSQYQSILTNSSGEKYLVYSSYESSSINDYNFFIAEKIDSGEMEVSDLQGFGSPYIEPKKIDAPEKGKYLSSKDAKDIIETISAEQNKIMIVDNEKVQIAFVEESGVVFINLSTNKESTIPLDIWDQKESKGLVRYPEDQPTKPSNPQKLIAGDKYIYNNSKGTTSELTLLSWDTDNISYEIKDPTDFGGGVANVKEVTRDKFNELITTGKIVPGDAKKLNVEAERIANKARKQEKENIPKQKQQIPPAKNPGKKLSEQSTDGSAPLEDFASVSDAVGLVQKNKDSGYQHRIAYDGNNIADLEIVVSAPNYQGSDVTGLKFRLQEIVAGKLVEDIESGKATDWTEIANVNVPSRENTDKGLVIDQYDTVEFNDTNGKTYVKILPDGTHIRLYRDLDGASYAFGNTVEVFSPNLDMTQDDLNDILKELGVSEASQQYATKGVLKTYGESRLLEYFYTVKSETGFFKDNPNEKATYLNNIKATWGVTSDDLIVKQSADGRMELLLSEDAARKILDYAAIDDVMYSSTS